MIQPLESAYRAAWYCFWTPSGALYVQPGRPVAEAHLPVLHPNRHWCFITAANPGSRRLSLQENRLRNLWLKTALRQQGIDTAPAWSGCPRRKWPVEPGFWLVLPTLTPAIELARRAGQRALLYGSPQKAAALYWLDHDR